MSLPPWPALAATNRSDSCWAGFAPARRRRLSTAHWPFVEKPQQVLADAGYCNEADLQTLEDRGVDGYVALGREGKQAVGVDPRKYPARSRMRKKLASLAGQVAYARRKWIAEAPHGWIKEGLGFRRFSLRGLQSVQGEWDLVCLALNIKRISALMAA